MNSGPSDWIPTTVGELVSVEHGWAFAGEYFVDGNEALPVVVAVGNFDYAGGLRFDRTRVKRYAGDYPEKYKLNAGNILLIMTCQTAGGEILGVPGRIPSDRNQYLHNQRLGLVRLRRPELLDTDFFFHLARSSVFNRQLLASASGSKILHTSPGRIEAVRFSRPPLREQQAIATLLGALDDKIESNRRLLIRALDLIAAETRAATADTGAPLLPVNGLARFVNGGAFTKGATGSGRMVLRIAELNSGPGGSTVYTDLDVPDDKTARPGDLLMSWSGSLDIYRWTRDEAIINQHIFKVIPHDLPAWLVHDRLTEVMPIFQSIAKDKATTMGHIQRGHLESTSVPMPSSEEIVRLDVRLGPLWDRLLLAEREIHTLAALRDALLPELLSGRIRVPGARRVVDEILA